jgi:hypothetical protein
MPIKKGLRIFIHILGTAKQGGTGHGQTPLPCIKATLVGENRKQQKERKEIEGKERVEVSLIGQ